MPRQNGSHFADDIFKCIFVNGNVFNFDQYLTEVCPIGNLSSLVQIMAWCQRGDKPLPEPMMTKSNDTYICIIWPEWVDTYQELLGPAMISYGVFWELRTLGTGRFGCSFHFDNFQTHFSDWYLEYLLWYIHSRKCCIITINDKSTLVQVMAWCHQVWSHLLKTSSLMNAEEKWKLYLITFIIYLPII